MSCVASSSEAGVEVSAMGGMSTDYSTPLCDASCVQAVRLLWAANDTQGLMNFWTSRSDPAPSTESLLKTLASSTRDAELCRVTLFRDILSGPTSVITEFGDYDLSDTNVAEELGGVADDDVTSLRLDGMGCSVELYEHSDFSGWKASFEPGEFDLDALRRSGGDNDAASAVRLKYDPSRRVLPGECRLVLFRDDEQKGRTSVMSKPGKYLLSDHNTNGHGEVGDDDLTSLRLDGESGCSVTLHENDDFSGWKAKFGPGVYDLRDILQQGGQNDATSAIRLFFPKPRGLFSYSQDSASDDSAGDVVGSFPEGFEHSKMKPPQYGLGSLSMPASGCEQLRDVPVSGIEEIGMTGNRRPNGPYWINTYDMTIYGLTLTGKSASDPELRGPFLVYCLLDGGKGGRFQGGGWTLLLSTTGSGTEFVYGSSHWSEATLLNDNEDTMSTVSQLFAAVSERDSSAIKTNSIDAKFATFNRLRVREFLAYWPSLDDEYDINDQHAGSDNSKPGPGNAVWLTGPVSNTTALEFFTKGQVFSHRPQSQSWWHEDLHSSQRVEDGDGVAQFGVNVMSRSIKLRWGYAFNDNSFWDTSPGDAHGGIGTNLNSAADMYEETESSRRGRRASKGGKPRPVLIFGRTGTESLEGPAATAFDARVREQQERMDEAEEMRRRQAEAEEKDAEGKVRVDCSAFLSCRPCAEQDGCGWCTGKRLCVEDVPWICTGEKYHVSHPDGERIPGKPGHARCPTVQEIEAARIKRREHEETLKKREKIEADRQNRRNERAERMRRNAEAREDDDENPELGAARRRARERHERVAEEEAERIRSEQGEGESSGEVDKEDEAFEHVEEIRSRAEAAELESGASRPYEVLEVAVDAKQSDIRRSYRKLSLKFHPDKNNKDKSVHADAIIAFADIVAAYEVIGTPDKRAAFDEAAGNGEAADFEVRYEEGKYEHDSDLYAGDKLITTLTDKVWEKRLVGDSIWLVECYAAWCPACQNFVSSWRETARNLIANDDELEIGAVNCEKQRSICGDWFEISSYPSVMLINRDYGMVQRYPKSREKAPELIREWALSISREWRYLMAASNVTMVTADTFPSVVLNSTDLWVVAFMDGVVCAQCRMAKTNMMRLSAGLRGMPVRIAIVDCEQPENQDFCYEKHGLPQPPHRPQVKAWPRSSGSKVELYEDEDTGNLRVKDGQQESAIRGELLYNVNMLEPHVALRIVEKSVRLALKDEMDEKVLREISRSLRHAAGDFASEKDEDEEDDMPPPPPPGGMHWDGPEQRHKPLPWNGFARPEGLPSLTRL